MEQEKSEEEYAKAFEKRKKEMQENEFIFNQSLTSVKEIKKVRLVDLHDIYKEHLHIEDTKRIDVVLAVDISSLPLVWISLNDKFGDRITFVNSEVELIQEEK